MYPNDWAIKCNEELFNEFKRVGGLIHQLNYIVQNDYEIKESDFIEWCKQAKLANKKVEELISKTIDYVKECEADCVPF